VDPGTKDPEPAVIFGILCTSQVVLHRYIPLLVVFHIQFTFCSQNASLNVYQLEITSASEKVSVFVGQSQVEQ